MACAYRMNIMSTREDYLKISCHRSHTNKHHLTTIVHTQI
jgi:hypothetical protein